MKMSNQELVMKLSRLILQNPQRMIKEQDIQNFCTNTDEYQQVVGDLVANFKKIGFTLSRSAFQKDRYFVLTAPGKDDVISPSMYGALALIIATLNEFGTDLEFDEAQGLFKEVWGEVEQLVGAQYLAIVEENGKPMLVVTPIGKAAFRTMLKDLRLKDLIQKFHEKE